MIPPQPSQADQVNELRVRAVLRSRAYKELFGRAFVAPWVPRAWWTRLLFRAWRDSGDGEHPLRIAGEQVLADLRDFAGLNQQTNFHPDPHVMAFREGKRAAVMRVIHHLNLDEAQVQQLIGVDDGL